MTFPGRRARGRDDTIGYRFRVLDKVGGAVVNWSFVLGPACMDAARNRLNKLR
jgi:hypothetical protein